MSVKTTLLPAFIIFANLAIHSADGAIVLEDFESNTLNGWTSTGGAWHVGGATSTNPNIPPAEGFFFARSGAPNVPSEADTGMLTSTAFTVTHTTLSFQSTGWSNGPGASDGVSYFQILDSGLNEKLRITTAQSDFWETESVDLLGIGLAPGDTFYLRAVDGRDFYQPLPGASYSWMAIDNVRMIGSAVSTEAVPEPTTLVIWCIAGLSCAMGASRRRR